MGSMFVSVGFWNYAWCLFCKSTGCKYVQMNVVVGMHACCFSTVNTYTTDHNKSVATSE